MSLDKHYMPKNLSDKVALGFTKFLRFLADTFFKKRYGHRAVVLETVSCSTWNGSWNANSPKIFKKDGR